MAEIIDPIVPELLRDIRELTSRRFVYEDGWCGMVPSDGELTEMQTGPPVPFAALSWREKADVLREFISWDHYREKGLDWLDQNAIENSVIEGKPPQKWLEGTSFLNPSLRAERREELIRETFELSREIGYAHFRAENFHRPDPVLIRLNPQERETFLRQWWDAAREQMYSSYQEQVAGLSNEALARNKQAYQTEIALAAAHENAGPGKTPDPLSAESPAHKDSSTGTLRKLLDTPAQNKPASGRKPEPPDKTHSH